MKPNQKSQIPNQKSNPGLRRAQWRMLLATMFCYLFYYTGRQNWGWVVKALRDDLGLDTVMTGTIAGAMLAAYGIGQFINGNLGDKFGGRIMVSLGAILSVGLTWITSFGNSFWTLLVPWTANGYAQSLGWAPGGRLISNWWGHRERAKAFGFYMFAAAFSTVLTFALSIAILQYMNWRWVFRLPVLLLLVGGIVYYLVARDKPEDLGFKPLDEPGPEPVAIGTEETTFDRYACAFKNWRFLCACVAIGFESMARYGLLTWVPLYYLGEDWKQNPASVWITLSLPFGMALGALSGGYLSERVFHSNRTRPIVLLLSLASAVSVAMYFVPRDQYVLGMTLLFLAGFFVYGPQSSFWARCPDLLGTKRAGTGVGVMDASAYAFAAAQGPLFGWIIATHGEASIFIATAAACALGVVTILFVRK